MCRPTSYFIRTSIRCSLGYLSPSCCRLPESIQSLPLSLLARTEEYYLTSTFTAAAAYAQVTTIASCTLSRVTAGRSSVCDNKRHTATAHAMRRNHRHMGENAALDYRYVVWWIPRWIPRNCAVGQSHVNPFFPSHTYNYTELPCPATAGGNGGNGRRWPGSRGSFTGKRVLKQFQQR